MYLVARNDGPEPTGWRSTTAANVLGHRVSTPVRVLPVSALTFTKSTSRARGAYVGPRAGAIVPDTDPAKTAPFHLGRLRQRNRACEQYFLV